MASLKDKLKEKIALLRLRQGDTEAFGYIYETYIEQIYRYIYFRTSDQGMAHDIAQDVFLQTWEYIVSKKPVQNLKSFLYKVAYHKVVDYYRVKERQTQLIDEMQERALQTGAPNSTDIEMHFLMKHIQSLKPEYQDIIVLKHVEGLSISEIAHIIGKDANNIRVTLHRALASLKEIYNAIQNRNKIQQKKNVVESPDQ